MESKVKKQPELIYPGQYLVIYVDITQQILMLDQMKIFCISNFHFGS